MDATMRLDWRPFCLPPDDKSARYSLAEPWRSGDVVFATDGRICIEVEPGLFEDFEPYECKHPDVAGVLKAMDGEHDWSELPPVAGPPNEADPWWRTPADCEECNGSGAHCCGCEYCKRKDCEFCDGTGERMVTPLDASEKVSVCGEWFAKKYLWTICQLPDVRVCVVTTEPEGHMLLYRFRGGRGALMGVKVAQ